MMDEAVERAPDEPAPVQQLEVTFVPPMRSKPVALISTDELTRLQTGTAMVIPARDGTVVPGYLRLYDAETVAQLEEEDNASTDLLIRFGNKMTAIVNLIRGTPEPNRAHSTHDVVELVAAVLAESDALRDRSEK
jgi:hypothetical protein